MKVWITKYALTQGIYEVEGEINKNCPNMLIVSETKESPYLRYFFTPEWHTTEEEAIKHAEQLRGKKLKSLEKQISKLKKILF